MKKIKNQNVAKAEVEVKENQLYDLETGEIIEAKEEKQEKVINPMPVRLKLINAQVSSKGKIGIFGMLYDSVDPDTGFLNIQNYVGKDKAVIVNTWFDGKDEKALALTKKAVMSDFVAVVSGNANFMKMHKILSDEEAKLLMSVLE